MASAMNMIKQMLSQPGQSGPSGVETIEKLVDRVHTSTLLEDRRDAVRALKSLSHKYRREVGERGMPVLLNVLNNDRSDAEISGFALDALTNIMSSEPSEEEATDDAEKLAGKFTEVFLGRTENLTLLLELLDDYDFHVRWPAVKLFTALLTNRGRETQDLILVNPNGVSKLLDLIADSREVIRNDGLLLLIQLTKSNASIQKIVAFNGAFERALEIVASEGYSDGGIVVEDCLLLLINLLKSNLSNQNLFKENSFIQRLTPFFQLTDEDQSGWSAQKVTNMHLMLQLVRHLVSPNNPSNATTACQKVLAHCGLLKLLCSILMASGVPADVLTETINTVSEAIRGCQENQEYFASVLAPSNPPRPAIVVLLMSMVNERQPFVLRCAVLYCFESFLYHNQLGQAQIVQTLLPSAADASSISAGQLLCGGLFSSDALSNWFCSVSLMHAVLANASQKEQLLRVQLATGPGMPPVSLLQQSANVLVSLSKEAMKLQTRVGLLMMLSNWLCACPVAVSHFLQDPNNVSFLISQISASDGDEQEGVVQGLCAYILGLCVLHSDSKAPNGFSKSGLREIITSRIHLETFCDKLNRVSRHESYSLAAKRAQISSKSPADVLFDHEFTTLFKKTEPEIVKCVQQTEESSPENDLEQHNSVVQQYKGIIRQQDEELQALRAEMTSLRPSVDTAQQQIAALTEQLQQARDTAALLRAQKGGSEEAASEFATLQNEMKQYRDQCTVQYQHIQKLTADLEATRQLNGHGGEGPGTERPGELEELRTALQQRDAHIQQLQQHIQNGGGGANLAQLEAEKTSLQDRLVKSNQDLMTCQQKIRSLESDLTSSKADCKSAREELEAVRREQEDLLVLLSDNDEKISKYRKQLTSLGQQVSDDENDFGLDDEEDGDDDDDDDAS